MNGYLRADGRRGIRNHLLVAYLVECAHHVAYEIAEPFIDEGVEVIGFPNCYPCAYAERMLARVCTHQNVSGVLLVSLGCEGFRLSALARAIRESGRPVEALVIQRSGGTTASIRAGHEWMRETLPAVTTQRTAAFGFSELTMGIVPSGPCGTIAGRETAAIGTLLDTLVERGARVILTDALSLDPGDELFRRTADPELARALRRASEKTRRYRAAFGKIPSANERSAASLGTTPVTGLLTPGDAPGAPGLYLLDSVPDGEPRFGPFDFNRSIAMGEAVACGAHLLVHMANDGSSTGSAVAPVVKICTDPTVYRTMSEDLDLDAGSADKSADGLQATLARIIHTIDGEPTVAERLGHSEFALIYKSFQAGTAGCPPTVA